MKASAHFLAMEWTQGSIPYFGQPEEACFMQAVKSEFGSRSSFSLDYLKDQPDRFTFFSDISNKITCKFNPPKPIC